MTISFLFSVVVTGHHLVACCCTELRKEKGGRHNSMIANLIVHAGDAGAMAQPTMQHAQVSSGGRLRDGPADGAAAAWRSSPDGSSRRQPRTQTLQQVFMLVVRAD